MIQWIRDMIQARRERQIIKYLTEMILENQTECGWCQGDPEQCICDDGPCEDCD